MPDYAKYDGWPDGENNMLDAVELPQSSLRRAVNYDVMDGGSLHRRRGRTQVYVGSIVPRTLYSDGKRALFVEGGNMWELVQNIDGSWSRMLFRTGVGNHPVAYLGLNDNIYWSNGLFTGVIDPEGRDLPWGIRGPHEQPTIGASNSGGSLTAGVYQVAITFADDLGQESGTPLAKEVTITSDAGSIEITDLPTPIDGSDILVYCSGPNGEGLYRVGRLLAGVPSYRITTVDNAQTIMLQTQFGIPPPAGDVIEYLNGRIYVADGNVVWFTDAMRYGLVKPHRNFLQFPDEVTVMKAVADGLYICADQTYWISGVDTTEFQQVPVLPYGAVKGTGINLPDSDNVAWFSEEGVIIGGLQAQITAVQDDKSAVGTFKNGAMIFRKQRGLRQIIATLGTGTQSALLAQDYVDLETARRGNAI